MRIYFLSATKAILKLNGLYVGAIDGFERHIELELKESLLAEIVPSDGLLPISFFINESLLFSPPDYLNVYLSDGEAVIYVSRFKEANRLSIVLQEEFYSNLLTIFSLGGAYLSLDGKGTSLTPLPSPFIKPDAKIEHISSLEIAAIWGGNNLLLVTQSGRQFLFENVSSCEFGDRLYISMPLETCTNAITRQEYSYDGAELVLENTAIDELEDASENILHFALFESILYGGDYKKYLSDSLKLKSDELRGYLGNFVSVSIPTSFFYLKHGNIPAAGLVYLKSGNLFEIKYFAVEIIDGKIDNIYPVE